MIELKKTKKSFVRYIESPISVADIAWLLDYTRSMEWDRCNLFLNVMTKHSKTRTCKYNLLYKVAVN